METIELTLAERGQIVIPKEARDALGLKPGARLQLRIEDGRLLIEKKVQLDLSKWVGHAVDDGLSTNQALADLRGRPVPWQADDANTLAAETKLAKASTSKARPTPK
jgi:AbrB family looped-hinge helix DNA binding protein